MRIVQGLLGLVMLGFLIWLAVLLGRLGLWADLFGKLAG
jgi:hypothetical protein